MLRKFLKAVSRDWGSLVTGGASIPLTVLALWANTPILRTAWAIFASTCLVIASFRIWSFEYHRAEAAEAKLTAPARPWVIIDSYSSALVEDEESNQEYLSESIHIVNRGLAPAVSIVIPDIQLAGRTARLRRDLPTLGPGESMDVYVSNLQNTLHRVYSKARDRIPQPPRGNLGTLRLPLNIDYRGLDHRVWATQQTLSYSLAGICFSIAHPDDSQQWTDLTGLDS